ncbi:MAG TPA: ATP-binding protein [Polyangiaceae bacterium]|nr:ATP-binding protein [Polyangiaceae bacterium]
MSAASLHRTPPPRLRASERPVRIGGALGLPLVPLAPLFVLVVSVLAAVVIGALGLNHLSLASSAHAEARAHLVADTLGARLAQIPEADRLAAIQLAARRTGAEILVARSDGSLAFDATLGAPPAERLKAGAAAGRGEIVTRMGTTRFWAKALASGHDVLFVFVRVPPAEGAPALLSALVALTTLLVSVAAIVAYSVARDADQDVRYLSERIHAMAKVRTEPAGEPLPPRTMDEVGVLTSAFNELVARFAAAEHAYHRDLRRAASADRDRASFLAAVSHELRTPLNAILGFADVLMQEVDGPLDATQREEVQQIRDSGAHLNDLIEDILDLSAIESGQLKLHPKNVDLYSVAQDVVRELSVVADKSHLALRLEGEPGVEVWADKRRLRQIVGNVVGNAVKFTQYGEVLVRIETRGAAGAVVVRDTGPGIRESERNLVFEEYRQAGGERAKHRGTGLGLAIARRLATMQGGAIELDSELGRGSTFTVTLPLAAPGGGARRQP